MWIIAVNVNEGGFVALGNPNCVAFDILRATIYKMSRAAMPQENFSADTTVVNIISRHMTVKCTSRTRIER